MRTIVVLSLIVLIFALPVGALVGFAAKKQKDAGLLRFAVLDKSIVVKVLPLLAAGVLLGVRGKFPPVSTLQISAVFTFFAAAIFIAYATYRLAIRRGSKA